MDIKFLHVWLNIRRQIQRCYLLEQLASGGLGFGSISREEFSTKEYSIYGRLGDKDDLYASL